MEGAGDQALFVWGLGYVLGADYLNFGLRIVYQAGGV